MVGFGAIFNNPFGGRNDVGSTKSTNTGRRAFIDPDADADIVDAKFTVLNERKPFIYTQNSQNNPGRRNPEDSFSAKKNFDFSESVPFSQAATANIAQSYVSDRSFATGSTKYGSLSGSFSSFGSPKEKLAQVGREFAYSA
ncbi:MAG: hypothetical protein VKK32_00475 [Candidatus Melainabacteria bacterium]|nr:hypothetical protein [Candidatus Melainabacteria bacterium]